MRLILALLLVLQLDPVLAAALCVQREHAMSTECAMPESPAPSERVLSPAGAEVVGGCAIAEFCLQSSPVVSQLSQEFQVAPVTHGSLASWSPLDAPPGVLTPPFHPPRV
jgi:hypothetical protein